MHSMSIRKGDSVQVITGKDKGKRGKVLRVDLESRRVVVEGINRAKKHMRPSKANPQGGVVEIELGVDASNVMLVCPGCDTPTRVSRVRAGGKSFLRKCKRCDTQF